MSSHLLPVPMTPKEEIPSGYPSIPFLYIPKKELPARSFTNQSSGININFGTKKETH